MLYNEACGERLSRLGFGCMRLPLKEDKGIDEGELQRMVDYAIKQNAELGRTLPAKGRSGVKTERTAEIKIAE